MSTMDDVAIYDGAVAPVLHTFGGISVDKETKTGFITAVYRESLADVPLEAQGKLWTRQGQLPTGAWRSSLRIVLPYMEAISGQNAAGYTAQSKVAFEDSIEVIAFSSGRTTIGNRRLLRQMMVNALHGTTLTTTPTTVGFVSDLFDRIVSPT